MGAIDPYGQQQNNSQGGQHRREHTAADQFPLQHLQGLGPLQVLCIRGGQGFGGIQRVKGGTAGFAAAQMFLHVLSGVRGAEFVVVQGQKIPYQIAGQVHVNASFSLVRAR